MVFFSSVEGSTLRYKFEFSFLHVVLQSYFRHSFGIMPPSDASAPSKSHIRNEKRKRARQLQSVRSTLQKNFTNSLQTELVDLTFAHKKTEAELACVKNANDRLQNIAQSATLDAFIYKRSAENHASKLVDKDRIIASLSSAAAAAPAVDSSPQAACRSPSRSPLGN